MTQTDCIVIGAGVVGLAVAAKLAESGREVIVIEQHKAIGTEVSSRNSEVIHAGIYYPTQSLKAKMCVRGKALLYEHCEYYNVPFKRCGKIIVATSKAEIPIIESYVSQAKKNGVDDLCWLGKAELHDLEPNLEGFSGVLSPSTGVIDSHQFMVSLQGILESEGGVIAFDSCVQHIMSSAGGQCLPRVVTENMELQANWVINAGGLHAPDLASDMDRIPQAKYAIGHYYSYSGERPFEHLIYPTAEDGGLGVHLTIDMAGQCKFGPDLRWLDSINYEFDDSKRESFIEAIKSYYPNLDERRLYPSYTGIRPKIAGPTGFSDFMLHFPSSHRDAGRINLIGIESPGLTASLAIAEAVCHEIHNSHKNIFTFSSIG